MAKITVEAFARLWGQVNHMPRKQLFTLKSLIEEKLTAGELTVTRTKRPGRPRKTAEPPTDAA